jgi:hypothetical protein
MRGSPRMRRRVIVVGFAVALASGVSALAAGNGNSPRRPPGRPADQSQAASEALVEIPQGADPLGYLNCTTPQQALNFPTYWAGTRFDGLTVSAVIRRCDTRRAGEAVRANFVAYLYGTCFLDDGYPCAPPIEVQTWPAEERNKASLVDITGTDTTVLGVPATRYEDGMRLELYRDDSTIVIFGYNAAQVDRFAAALVEGPIVLTQLAQYDLVWDSECRTSNVCTARPAR